MSMFCNLIGAVLNIFLDALFVSYFKFGMAGAAWSTVIGQVISAIVAIWFLCHCQSVKLKLTHLIPRWQHLKRILSLGSAPFVNAIAMVVVQVAMNKSLNYYGAMSVYGL